MYKSSALLLLGVLCMSSVTNAIWNGHPAPLTPHHAHILFMNAAGAGLFGGGSLITSRHVLTSAQNIQGFVIWHVGLGSNNFNQLTTIVSTNATQHPQFNAATRINDIGIIILPTDVIFTDNINPVRLAALNFVTPHANEQITVVGFGQTTDPGARTDILQRAFKRVTLPARCTQIFPAVNIANQFCAEDAAPRSSNICNGDIGGGLTVRVDGIPTLVGISSIVMRACAGIEPSAYTLVSAHRAWITQVTTI